MLKEEVFDFYAGTSCLKELFVILHPVNLITSRGKKHLVSCKTFVKS